MTLERRTPLKRSPMKRSTTQMVRSAIKRKTGRSKSDFPDEVVRVVKLRKFCQFPECSSPIQHIHHIRLRSQGGKGTLDNAAGLCRVHHRWVHDHPAAAHEMGLLRLTKGSSTSG